MPKKGDFEQVSREMEELGQERVRVRGVQKYVFYLVRIGNFLLFSFGLVVFYCTTSKGPWSSLEEGDEGCTGTSGKLLCL